MTKQQVQAAVRSRGLSREKRNKYTQGAKRTQVAWGYSDCSSFVRWCWLMVTGVDIGSYTGAQVKDADLTTIHQGGSYPELSKLQIGDLVYFKNSTSSNAYGVSHVEMVIEVGSTLATCKLLGHGSGTGPTTKPNLKSYCASRNYLMTRRPKVLEKTWTLGQRIIEKGCYGEDVAELQRGLILLGISVGSSGADWDCGDTTDAAIRKFQKAYGLTVDGQFGPKSLTKFNELLSAADPESPEDTGPVTEDDYPDDEQTTDQPETESDAPDDADDTTDEVTGEEPSPEADGSMGAGSTNPYPVPTKIKRKGSTGAAVKWIQWQLKQLGYNLGKYGPNKDGIDGDFGSYTLKAVKAFQKANKDVNGKQLVVDGEVGQLTVGALAASGTGESGGGDTPTEDTTTGRIYDVSSYDGNIDFAQLAALTGKQKCELLIIRAQASESGTKVDSKLARNIKNCKQYGIRYGVYAYTYAATAAQGRADADRFYENVISAGGEPLCWAIDAEEGKNTKASVEAMRKQLRERAGTDAAIWFYSFDSRVRSWASIMTNYDGVWTARWNTPDIAPGYTDYDLWQFGYTNVPGIRKTTDTSRIHPGKTLERVLSRRAAA